MIWRLGSEKSLAVTGCELLFLYWSLDKILLFIVALSCHNWGEPFFRRQDWGSSHWRRGISGKKKSLSNHSHCWPQFDRSVSTIGGLAINNLHEGSAASIPERYLTDFNRESTTSNNQKYLPDFSPHVNLFSKEKIRWIFSKIISAKLLLDKMPIISSSSHCVNWINV